MYILQNDHHSKSGCHLSLYSYNLFFLLMRTVKILSNVQIGNKHFPFLT